MQNRHHHSTFPSAQCNCTLAKNVKYIPVYLYFLFIPTSISHISTRRLFAAIVKMEEGKEEGGNGREHLDLQPLGSRRTMELRKKGRRRRIAISISPSLIRRTFLSRKKGKNVQYSGPPLKTFLFHMVKKKLTVVKSRLLC